MQLSADAAGLEDMRLFKVVLTGLFAFVAVLAGLFIAAVAIITSLVVSLLGRSRPKGASAGNTPLPRAPAMARSYSAPRDVEAIDVTATKVSVDAASR